MWPRAGLCMPAMVRISEVLPAPLAPTMATIEPSSISRKRRRAPAHRRKTRQDFRPLASCVDRLRAEVGVDHRAIAHHFCRRPSAMAAPWCSTRMREASAITARITCSISRMVRPGFAVEFAQNRHDAVGLGRPQPRHHFIEQQQFRIGGERTRHFQPLAVGQRKRRGALVTLVVKFKTAQHLVRMRARSSDMHDGATARRRSHCPRRKVPEMAARSGRCGRCRAGKFGRAASPSIRSFAKVMVPLSGASTPAIMLNSVVLPAPFGPITAKMPPCSPRSRDGRPQPDRGSVC